jgi:hypothetical protein
MNLPALKAILDPQKYAKHHLRKSNRKGAEGEKGYGPILKFV